MALLRGAGLRPHALHPGAIQGKERIKFCHLATLRLGGRGQLVHDERLQRLLLHLRLLQGSHQAVPEGRRIPALLPQATGKARLT